MVAADQPTTVCGGMQITVRCITTTNLGFLQWAINGEQKFNIDDLVGVSMNKSVVEGVFVSRTRVANAYVSSASLMCRRPLLCVVDTNNSFKLKNKDAYM